MPGVLVSRREFEQRHRPWEDRRGDRSRDWSDAAMSSGTPGWHAASRSKGDAQGIVFFSCMHVKSLQSCLTLCYSMDCSLPGSSVHGIFQAEVLEWVTISSSRGASQPRN